MCSPSLCSASKWILWQFGCSKNLGEFVENVSCVIGSVWQSRHVGWLTKRKLGWFLWLLSTYVFCALQHVLKRWIEYQTSVVTQFYTGHNEPHAWTSFTCFCVVPLRWCDWYSAVLRSKLSPTSGTRSCTWSRPGPMPSATSPSTKWSKTPTRSWRWKVQSKAGLNSRVNI